VRRKGGRARTYREHLRRDVNSVAREEVFVLVGELGPLAEGREEGAAEVVEDGFCKGGREGGRDVRRVLRKLL